MSKQGWMEEMQPRPNTAINNYDMPFVHARWEAERAMNGGGQVTAGQGTSSPRLLENGQVTEVGVAKGDGQNEDVGDRALSETNRPRKQVANEGSATDTQAPASAIANSSAPTQQVQLPSFAVVAANPTLQPIIGEDAPNRRGGIHRLVQDAGVMNFPAIARVNASVGPSRVESGRVMSFVKAKGRRGIGGTELVWAVERGLKKKYSLRKSEVVVTGTREQWL